MILQFSPTVNGAITVLARLIGLAVFAGFLAAGVALLYRWYVRERVPSGLALLFGLAGVAVVLNTTPLLAAEIAATDEALEIVDALFNIVAFAGSAAAAFAGIRFGDHLGTNLDAAGGTGDVDSDVSEIVQTVGRVTAVQLPDEIADIVGYDPVSEATKESLAGRRFLFPRRLTKAELRDRLVSRLKTDYGVGHVDVEFGDGGAVEFLGVGSRAAGIGPTLPPATNAVAIRADPAHAASAGDLVQVWETDPMERVLTGELRGVAGDVVTVAIDAADTPKLNPSDRYKLVTLPVQNRPDREFASLLRAADETLATVTVEAGSDLDGVALDSLDVTVAAITREDERPEPLPARSRMLRAGDVVYVIATPEILRKVETAAEGPEGAVSSAVPDARPAGSQPGMTGPEAGSAQTDPESSKTDPEASQTDPDPEPAVERTERTDPDPEPTDPEPQSTSSESEPADPDEDSRGGDGAVSDQSPTEESDIPEATADEDPLSGDAFVDTDDLPGMDSDVATPTVPGEDSDDSRGDQRPEDERDDAARESSDDGATGEDDDASEEPGSIDDALDSMEPLDLGEETDAEAGDDTVDEPVTDAPADDLLEGSIDDAAGESTDDAPGESGEEAAEDDSVPFTPLDVGDDDPLADPLTGADEDDDDADRGRGN